jgi:hypothetical protein
MKKKKIFQILIMLVLIASSSLALQCFGFQIGPQTRKEVAYEEGLILMKEENEELVARIEGINERERKPAEAEEAELLESPEEEEKLIPDGPITYSGDALGLAVALVVNFKTKVVTGSINLSGDDYVDATITKGKINIDTFEITTNFSGIMGSGEYNEAAPFNGTITGKVSDDLSKFKGVILDDEGDGGEFTINK